MSVYWEGSDLLDHNLQAIRDLQNRYQSVSFLHFISPAYFLTKRPALNLSNQKKIKSITSNQATGLYLAPWKSITDQAGVMFRVSPTFWGRPSLSCLRDCGRNIPLAVYNRNAINRLFTTSLKVMSESQFPHSQMFRIAGWSHSSDIASVAAQHGLQIDFSAINPEQIKRRLGYFPIFTWVKQNWQQFSGVFAPRQIQTNHGQVIVVPQSGGVVDYSSKAESMALFSKFLTNKSDLAVFNIGLHQETAYTYTPRLTQILDTIIAQKPHLDSEALTFNWNSYRKKLLPNSH